MALLVARLQALYGSLTASPATADRAVLLMQVEHEIQRFLFRFRDELPADTQRQLMQSIAKLRESIVLAAALSGPEARSGH